MGSEILADHMARPRHRGTLPGATGRSIHTCPATGDAIRISLRIEGDQVEARYSTFGDPVLSGIASYVCETIHARGLHNVPWLSAERLVQVLGLPPAKARYAQIVMLTLLEAIQDHYRRQRLSREVGP